MTTSRAGTLGPMASELELVRQPGLCVPSPAAAQHLHGARPHRTGRSSPSFLLKRRLPVIPLKQTNGVISLVTRCSDHCQTTG